MAGELDVQGVNASELYAKMTDVGVSQVDAKLLVGSLLIDIFGKRPRTFNYVTPFPGADAACTSDFVRTFQHEDWVDGESVVQAEETTGELGFNRRFHEIEADLDALGADVALAFTCLASMRSSLRALLDELRGELNRINAQLSSEENPSLSPVRPNFEFVGKTKVNNVDKYILRDGDQFSLVDLAGPVINPVDKGWTDKVDKSAYVDIIAQATEKVRATPELDAAIKGGATAGDLVRDYGDTEVATTPQGDKLLLRDMLKDVAPDTTFHDAADPDGAVFTAAVRSAPPDAAVEMRDTVLKANARDQSATVIADSSPAVLTGVGPAMNDNLKAAGVVTVDSLARTTPDALVANMNAAGVTNVDSAAVTHAIVAARVARNLRVGG
jgi:predicted flap endonuclease-1-like 5' DNA nuclease